MTRIRWSNNAGTTLALSISNVDTTATLASGTGALFPSPAAGEYFTMTFSAGVDREIVNVTNRVGDVVTIVRGQEGTTALAWNAGDSAENLLTAESMRLLWLAGSLTYPDGYRANQDGSIEKWFQAAANTGGGLNTTLIPIPFGAGGAYSTVILSLQICFDGNSPVGSGDPGSMSIQAYNLGTVEVTTNYDVPGPLGVQIRLLGV